MYLSSQTGARPPPEVSVIASLGRPIQAGSLASHAALPPPFLLCAPVGKQGRVCGAFKWGLCRGNFTGTDLWLSGRQIFAAVCGLWRCGVLITVLRW